MRERSELSWIQALKIYNTNPAVWTIPRKGYPPHEKVLEIQGKTRTAEKSRATRQQKMIQQVEKDVKRQQQLDRLTDNLKMVVGINRLRKLFNK